MAPAEEDSPLFIGGLPVGSYEDGEHPEPATAGPPRPRRAHRQERGAREVVVTDVDMPFWSMVSFMVKLTFAAIPAVIIITVIMAMLSVILAALGVSLGHL